MRGKRNDSECSVEGCDRRGNGGNGLCEMHAKRNRKYGDPLITKKPRRDPVCTVADCVRPHHANGLCTMHEQRRRAGLPLEGPRINALRRAPCSIEGCDSVSSAKGLCPMHYQRMVRYGDPTIEPVVKLPPGSRSWTRSEQNRFYRYGVTPDEFARMLQAQGGKCLGCHRTNPAGNGWCVDHCHKSGAVRRVLCSNCNTILGLAFEDEATLLRLAALVADQISP